MDLDPGDRARLQRIESGLMADDPALVQQFRSWSPWSGRGPLPTGWSAVPLWALCVFLVAFCTWAVSPVLGVLVAAIGGIVWAWVHGARRARAARRR